MVIGDFVRPTMRLARLRRAERTACPATSSPESLRLVGKWKLRSIDGHDLPAVVWSEMGKPGVRQIADTLLILADGQYRSRASYLFVCAVTGTESTAEWESVGTWKCGSRARFRTSYGACYSGRLTGGVLLIERAFGRHEYSADEST
jgi:hypothetical protein